MTGAHHSLRIQRFPWTLRTAGIAGAVFAMLQSPTLQSHPAVHRAGAGYPSRSDRVLYGCFPYPIQLRAQAWYNTTHRGTSCPGVVRRPPAYRETFSMLNLCDTVLEIIGETPRLRVHRIVQGLLAPIYTKIEFVSPGGSVKGRIARDRVEGAQADGRFKPGGAIVETTSGNTGVGLAKVAGVKGCRCIFIMPDKMRAGKIRLL
ncbi:MAG: pyridoxal-phosphate dependent enzyme [Planctomycetes bacterium]|nr:pyridoxal-phosphate dependent enzyme [Planctomycetota bacterium]